MRIELHRRFAFPVACLALALVGIPIGISTRKGGKSAGYVNAIFLAFFGYYLSSVSLIGVAQQRKLPVPVAVWLPDAVFVIAGIVFLVRMERPGDRDLLVELQRIRRAGVCGPEARRRTAARAPRVRRRSGFRCFRRWSTPTSFRISCFTSRWCWRASS